MTAPLDSVRVLDLTGPEGHLCGRLLADLGAEVVKVEPTAGDPGRRLGPFNSGVSHPEASITFAYFNAGKKSVALDLEQPADRGRFRRLAKAADVILEGFPPGILAGWELDYPDLRKDNPGLVMTSVTGFGLTGPRSGYKAPSIVASAMGGVMYLCGAAEEPPLSEPPNQPYHLASAYAAAGTLLALRRRDATGFGQRVEVSAIDAQAAQQHIIVNYSANANVLKRAGSRTPVGGGMPYGIYPTAGGFCHLVVIATPHWQRFVEWMGRPEALTDPIWDNRHVRIANGELIEAMTAEFSRGFTKGEFFTQGQSRRITTAPVNRPDEFIRDVHVRESGVFRTVEHPLMGATKLARPPFQLSASPAEIRAAAPLLGSDHAEGLGWKAKGPRADPAPDAEERRPLEGVRVLDLSQAVAGPALTQLLASFGAEVIKVESAAHPQRGRVRPGIDPRIILQQRVTFADINRNKRSVTLDLGSEAGREVVRRLVSQCDVVVENFSPRVMDRWGLGYESLRRLRGDVIMARMPGFGLTGPYRDYLGLAAVAMAVTGMYHLWSYPGAPEPAGPPIWTPDYLSAAFGAVALLAALRRRDATGEGQLVEVSQMDATAFVMGWAYLDYFAEGRVQGPAGNDHPQYAPHGAYPCQGDDQWCVIAVTSDAEWRALCGAMDALSLAADPKFAAASGRLRHRDELDRLVSAWTRGRSAESVMETLQGAGVPAAPVQDGRSLFCDPHLRRRGFFSVIDHPQTGPIEYPNVPLRLWDSPARLDRWHTMGQDNDYVMKTLLGMTDDEMAALRGAGVLR